MRKLVTVREISDIQPIPGADNIEVATIDGWKCVVVKGAFKVHDAACYFEIDSLIPVEHDAFEFLREKAKYRNVEGKLCHRLRTIKLKGQISQGLALPVSELAPLRLSQSADFEELLGVTQYAPPVPGSLAGKVKGNYPSFIPKTDQERVQNMWKDIKSRSDLYEITIKEDGSSMTIYRMGDQFGVCSRNWELDETDDNHYWTVVRNKNLREKLNSLNAYDNLAFQGELMGPGVQGNNEGLLELDFFVYDIWDIEQKKYLPAEERIALCKLLGISHVPVINIGDILLCEWVLEELLEFAAGPSLNPKAIREGLVFKSLDDPWFSFKVISNQYLLKHGDR